MNTWTEGNHFTPLGWRTNALRRMHRKIVVIDGQRAFVGGINYSADHLADFGPPTSAMPLVLSHSRLTELTPAHRLWSRPQWQVRRLLFL